MSLKAQVRRRLMQKLEGLRAAGVQTVPRGSGDLVIPDMPEPPSTAPGSDAAVDRQGPQSQPTRGAVSPEPESTRPAAISGPSVSASQYGAPVAADQRQAALDVLNQEVSRCMACPDLCNSRKNTVFGVGNPNARLCFVGEGPGADEDRIGEPFVGAAGQLLDKIIEACKMSRDDVYILNTVKCRPPGNRNPSETELANCWPFAIRQLEVLQPEFICCLGSVAARTVLSTKSSISKLRGEFHAFRSSQVVVTYHPAYLLRTPTAKKHTWNDMKMLMAAMGMPI